MTLINSVYKKNVFYYQNKSPQKNVSLETVKLNPHKICKILQVKQSTKFSQCKRVTHSILQILNS